MRLVYDGEPPKPKELNVVRKKAYCKQPLLDESLLVHPKDRGIANVIVWLALEKDEPAAAVHPMYGATAKSTVTLNIRNCRYEPHLVLLRTSQTLSVENLDPVAFCTKYDAQENPAISRIIPSSTKPEKLTFPRREGLPVRWECSVHPWMKAWMIVRDTPYMAASDESGNLKLTNLPTGKWKFRIWHERSGWIQKATLGDKAVEWWCGQIELEIKPGKNDLGDVVKPEVFKEVPHSRSVLVFGLFYAPLIRDVLWLTVVLARTLGWWLHATRMQRGMDRMQRDTDELTVRNEMLSGAMEDIGMHPSFDDRVLRVKRTAEGPEWDEMTIQKSNYFGPDGRPSSLKYPIVPDESSVPRNPD